MSQERYETKGVATTEQKKLMLRRFFFTAAESIARGCVWNSPSILYPRADEAHVKRFLSSMLRKYPNYDTPQMRPQARPTRGLWIGRGGRYERSVGAVGRGCR